MTSKLIFEITKDLKDYIDKYSIAKILLPRFTHDDIYLNGWVLLKLINNLNIKLYYAPVDCANRDYAKTNSINIYYSLYIEAKANDLVLSPIDKTDIFSYCYFKHGDGSADYFPFRNIFKSDLLKIAEHLGRSNFNISKPNRYGLVPSDIEWAAGEFEKIGEENHPKNNNQWFKYTLHQKEVLSKLYEIRKMKQYKQLRINI